MSAPCTDVASDIMSEPTESEAAVEAPAVPDPSQPSAAAAGAGADAAAAPPSAASLGAERRRRSRWGNKSEDTSATAAAAGAAAIQQLPGAAVPVAAAAADGEQPRKRSRWGTKKEEVADPLLMAVQMGIPLATLQQMSDKQKESLPKLKMRIDEIDVLLRLPDAGVSEIPPERRSPSPEPIFDRTGVRVNPREVRRRQALEQERTQLLDSLKPKPAGQRYWRKIIVPVDKYPGYNFFGAIIGPRGNAQKRMEKESGCKIVVRGKGAIKDGCGRHDGRPLGPEDEEPMHVLIEGPDEETVEAGQKIVEVVLNPYSTDAVQAKEKQMRELAILNGTLKEEANNAADWSKAAAKGALFQPGRSLPPPPSAPPGIGGSTPSMDDEYAMFMNELGGSAPGKAAGGGGAPSGGLPGLPQAPSDLAAAAINSAPWAALASDPGPPPRGAALLPPPGAALPPPPSSGVLPPGRPREERRRRTAAAVGGAAGCPAGCPAWTAPSARLPAASAWLSAARLPAAATSGLSGASAAARHGTAGRIPGVPPPPPGMAPPRRLPPPPDGADEPPPPPPPR